jgi:hypothetical protein
MSAKATRDPEYFIVQMEAETSQKMHPVGAKNEHFERNFDRASDVQLAKVALPKPSAMSEAERIAIAACFVRHAISRTALAEIDWSSRLARSIYQLRCTRAWRMALRVAFIGVSIIIAWEPPVTGSGIAPFAWWGACSAVEIASALVFVCDFVCQLISMHPRRFVRDRGVRRQALPAACVARAAATAAAVPVEDVPSHGCLDLAIAAVAHRPHHPPRDGAHLLHAARTRTLRP